MPLRTFLLLIMVTGIVVAQTATMLPPSAAPGGNAFGSISGTVMAPAAHLRDVRVELRNIATGATVATTTAWDGSFQINNIPPGIYEIIASSGMQESREQVEVESTPVSVTLQLASGSRQLPCSSAGSVSMAQLEVPEKARREYAKAEAAYEKNKLSETREHLERALAKAPHYADALALRGVLAFDAGDRDEALASAQQALAADPACARAYVIQGAVLNLEEKFDDAIRSLERAAALAPTSWQAYFELSKAMLAKNQFEQSLTYATKAADLMSNFPEIWMVKAYALLGMQRYQEAVDELERFLAAEPSGPQADYARATLTQARTLLNTSAMQ